MDLLVRTRDPDDERQVRIRLTDKGRALKQPASEIPACVGAALDMAPEQLSELMQTMKQVQERLAAGLAGARTDK